MSMAETREAHAARAIEITGLRAHLKALDDQRARARAALAELMRKDRAEALDRRALDSRAACRAAVLSMTARERADYAIFVKHGFSAAEAVAKVLGIAWLDRANDYLETRGRRPFSAHACFPASVRAS